jgi:hypothetical protein
MKPSLLDEFIFKIQNADPTLLFLALAALLLVVGFACRMGRNQKDSKQGYRKIDDEDDSVFIRPVARRLRFNATWTVRCHRQGTQKLRVVFTHKGKARSGVTELELWQE